MQHLKLFCLLIVISQLCFTISGVRWFGFRNKDDKDDKDDCEPEIVAIRKTKVLPIAVPVYNKKRVYSVKTRKMRKDEEDDAEQERKTTEEPEEGESKEVERLDRPEKANNSTDQSRTNERAESSNENPVRLSLQSVRDEQESFEPDDGSSENADYETDELIRRAIEDDDEDIEELVSNDDL